MPVFLPAPEPPPRASDGQGWNRLSIVGGASTPGVGDQCALLPRSYPTFLESLDTRRARWGGFGPCSRKGACEGCPVLDAPPKRLNAFGDRVLVRIHPGDGQPHLMNHPEKGWASVSMWWTWAELRRLVGWEVGERYRDEHGEGVWLRRSPQG